MVSRRSRTANLIVLTGTLLVCLVVFELAVRVFIGPAAHAYGTLFGDLPPVRVIPDAPPSVGDDTVVTTIEDEEVTHGDLHGLYDPHPVLGYEPRRSVVSARGWWRTNAIGAREDEETPAEKRPGTRRVLVFGESFANGSRLRQSETFPHILDRLRDDLDVVNLGVDGYGMGQCLLRYRSLLREGLEHDLVLLVWVPSVDLWREVNTIRWLGQGWTSYTVMPRFTLVNGRLELVRSPYPRGLEIYENNRGRLAPELRSHLMLYDRYFVPARHESPAILGQLILYKLLARRYYSAKIEAVNRSLMDTDSEAMRISRGIFREMAADAERAGSSFSLVLLPDRDDYYDLRLRPRYFAKWTAMRRFVCAGESICIDLTDRILALSDNQVDAAWDGTHYGPSVNSRIAAWLSTEMER